MPLRIGIMGGTLDPVHNGHIAIAQIALSDCGLDRVMLLPAGDPPHKRRESAKEDRLAMARLAAEGRERLFVSDMEILREGTTYTVDTLTALHEERPDVEWIYIIGADTLHVLDKWYRFDRVAGLCSFAAVGRPGCDSVQEDLEYLASRYGAVIRLIDRSGPDISSTTIRDRVAEGKPVRDLVPGEVADYIRDHGLYLCPMTWREIDERLRTDLKPNRYRHTLGVAETAERLAPRWGVEPMRARLAGLLHDCAKSMDPAAMAARVRSEVADADGQELAMPKVLHAPAGMLLAREVYGVRDPSILSAIRKHTLGDPDMSPLEKLIYVADFIEPGRKPFPGLDEARRLAESDPDGALVMCAQLSCSYVTEKGGKAHPRTVLMMKRYGRNEEV